MVLTVATVWCGVVFYQTISSWVIGTLASLSVLSGLWLFYQQQDGTVLLLASSFLIIHVATLTLITSSLSFWLVAGITAALVCGLAFSTVNHSLQPLDYLLVILIATIPLSVVLYLPTDLASLSVLATLPFLVLFPLILNIKKVRPLALVAQAAIVGVIGAGLIAATSIMFT